MRVIYLHGFASSPASRKARFFVEKLAEHGLAVEALDLAPDFERLTISGQLNVLDKAAKGDAVRLVGSSMGGYLAAIYAAAHPEVERLVLMAPAFDFHRLWVKELGPQKLAEWRINGFVSVFHYGTGREERLHYGMMEDAERYPAFPDFRQPALILHGKQDRVVPIEKSEQFSNTHPNASLVELETGHEMTDVLNEIWDLSGRFLLDRSREVT